MKVELPSAGKAPYGWPAFPLVQRRRRRIAPRRGTLPSVGQVVLGGETTRRIPPPVVALAILLHLAMLVIAWVLADEQALPQPREQSLVMRIDHIVELEPPPKPAPVAVAEAAPPPPAPPPPPLPKPVERIKPKPVAPRRVAALPKKATVRKAAPVREPAEPAQAAQVVASETNAPAAASAPFDMVTGGSNSYAGGATSSSGKSKEAVKEILVNYEQALLAWIERHKRYPRAALRRRAQGRPVLEITIDKHGRLVEHRLVESSHQAELDKEALAMVERAEPYPKFPEDHGGSTYAFRFGVDFRVTGR